MRWARANQCSRTELLERWDSSDLSYELAFDEVEPRPLPWEMLAVQVATIANSQPRKRPVNPEDLIPGEKRRQSNAEIRARLSMLRGS